MLSAKHNSQGMTLIEIMVAVAIVAILFAAAAPDFTIWIKNTRIRSATDNVQNGLTLAKTEAVHRNTIAQFVSCGGTTWEVIAASATASANVCGNPATVGWEKIQQSGQNGTSTVFAQPSQSTIAFNGMGRQVSTTDLVNGGTTPAPPVAVAIDVNATLTGATTYANAVTECVAVAAANSKLRCLRITVSSGGLVRMCDPALAAGTPQGC